MKNAILVTVLLVAAVSLEGCRPQPGSIINPTQGLPTGGAVIEAIPSETPRSTSTPAPTPAPSRPPSPTPLHTLLPMPTPTLAPAEASTPDFASHLPTAGKVCSASLASESQPSGSSALPGKAVILYSDQESSSWQMTSSGFGQDTWGASDESRITTLICFKSSVEENDFYSPPATEVTWRIAVVDLRSEQVIDAATFKGKTGPDHGDFPPTDLEETLTRYLAHVWGKSALPVFYSGGTEVLKVAFSPDGRSIMAVSEGATLRKWDVSTWRLEVDHRLDGLCVGCGAEPGSVDFSPDGSRLAGINLQDESIRVFDVETGAEIIALPQGSKGAGVAYSPDGRLLASAGDDRSVKVWNATTGERVGSFFVSKDVPFYVPNLAFSPDGSVLAVASGSFGVIKADQDTPITLWSVAEGRELGAIALRSDGPVSIAFSPDGKLLAAYGTEGISLWDVIRQKKVQTIQPTKPGKWERPGRGVAFSPDGKLLACGVLGGVQLFDVATGSGLQTFTGPLSNESVFAVAFSPDGALLVAGATQQHVPLSYYEGEGTVWVWRLPQR
jgi:WD40 repeat protein